MDEYNERLDLVNAKDVVIGTILRGEMAKASYKQSGLFVRFVNGFVVNKSGLVWAQTRSLNKFIAPGGLDFSVAEHVRSGETYDDAIIRGIKEELGWHLNISALTQIGTLPPTHPKPVFDKVYALFDYEGPDPVINLEEITRAQWLSLAYIKDHLKNSRITQKASLLPAIALLEKTLR